MMYKKIASFALLGSLAMGPLAGCQSLPGGEKEQGAVLGGVGGALAGAAVSKNNRGLGALIGGALGAGGGYLVGAKMDKDGTNSDSLREDAVRASERAERNPATVEDVARSRTADLNEDGFVTLDEVVAMERADLGEREQIARLERTQQVFELTEQQERYLEDRGVSRDVVREMRTMNQDSGVQTASDVDRGSDRLERREDRIERLDRTEDRLDRTGRYDRERTGNMAR